MSTNDSPLSKYVVYHDTKATSELLWDLLTERPAPSIIAVIACAVMILVPGLFLIATIIALVLLICYYTRKDSLIFFLPHTAKNKVDKNDRKIGKDNEYNKPQGFIFWGYIIEGYDRGLQAYAKFESALRHVLVLGTTGAGKTEALLSIAANFLCCGGGVIYNDGKGTTKLLYQFFSISRYFGREDQVLTINYTKENSARRPDPAALVSHAMAPYSFGSWDNNAQLTQALMPDDKGSQNKVFSDGAVSLINAVMPALCDLRELGLVRISPKLIRNSTNYDEFCKLIRHPLISETTRESMLQFVRSRSGFNPEKPANEQPDEVTKQWGYSQAYFARALQMLSDVYANIYSYDTGEIDFRDVVLQDRILITILPSMTKTPDEMSQLGKMVLFAIRSALALGLGGDVEGTKADVLDANVTSSSRPSICINDEVAFYLAAGSGITAAQARSLMMVFVFSGQEFASIKHVAEKEAEQYWANTRWKIVMASEGDNETISRLQQLLGKTYAYVRTGLKWNTNSMFGGHIQNKDVNLTQVERLDINDLRSLKEGEAYLIYENIKVKIRTFHHGIGDREFTEQLRILSCPDPIIEPPRGPYKDVLSAEHYQTMLIVREWLKNLQAGETNTKGMTKPSNKLHIALNAAQYLPELQNEFDSLSAPEQGLFAIHAYANGLRIKEAHENGGLDTDEDDDGLLSNISGSFGNDGFLENMHSSPQNDNASVPGDTGPSATDIINDLLGGATKTKQSAFASVMEYLSSDDAESDTNDPAPAQEAPEKPQKVSSPLSSIVRKDDDEDTVFMPPQLSSEDLDSNMIDSDDIQNLAPVTEDEELRKSIAPIAKSRYLPENSLHRIAQSTARLEKALGATQAQANSSAVETAQQVVDAVKYPKTKLKRVDDKLNHIRSILDDHLKRI